MEKWAAETHILQHIFPQYAPSDWADDGLAKTLDALHKVGLESIQGSISGHIVVEFDLNLDEIHYDTTSVSLWGTYDSTSGEMAVFRSFPASMTATPATLFCPFLTGNGCGN